LNDAHYELDTASKDTVGYFIGRGAFGSVMRYRLVSEEDSGKTDSRPPKLIAVKEMIVTDKDRAFSTESLILQQLCHVNIVGYVGFQQRDIFMYLCMELCDGNLSDFIKNNEVRAYRSEIPGYCRQIATGLAYLHSNKIAHRDLKTENILTKNSSTEDGKITLKLADFGLSKLIDADQFRKCTTLGTRDYMAPEVARALYESEASYEGYSPDALKKTDMFSLGVIFYEIAAGEVPFKYKELVLDGESMVDLRPRNRVILRIP